MNRKTLLPVVVMLALVLAACGTAEEAPEAAVVVEEAATEEVAEEAMQQSIAEIAVEDGRFTTLVAALTAADLVDTMAGEGSFTVFAPTDDAFAALPEGTVEALLADIPALTDILLYHVLGDAVMSETALTLDGSDVETLSGASFTVSVRDGSLYIDDSQVIIADIEASNGVIHVIDAVLIP